VSYKENQVKNPETCPGIKDFLRPTLSYVQCHVCGGNVELWSDEDVGFCNDCGAEWKRPDKNASCLDYCQYADVCRGIIASRKAGSQ
jgi:hypothetical protein